MDGKVRIVHEASDSSDESLMLAYQRGDEAAFGLLYARHSGRVYGYLMNGLRDKAMTDDVFQATFMKLHKARSSYDSSFPFLPWLFTISRGVMIDHLRKSKRILEDGDSEAIEQAAAHDVVLAPELPELTALPRTQRKAVEMRYGEDLSFEEIAKRLETTPMNVRQLVSRAVKKLRASK